MHHRIASQSVKKESLMMWRALGPLCFSLFFCSASWADVDKTRVAPQLKPIDVSGSPDLQVMAIKRWVAKFNNEKVGSASQGMFCGNPKDIRFTEEIGKAVLRDFAATVRRELSAAGYPKANESLFTSSPADGTAPLEYEIGAALTELELNLCGAAGGEMEGGVWLKLRWELYSPRERRVVFSATTEGSAQTTAREKKPFVDLSHQAVAQAARNLLADPAFVENASRKALTATPAAAQVGLPIAKRATGTQVIADNMAVLQSAVATLYSGTGSGSGFYIHRDGWMLTNQHVVGDSKFIKVKLANGRELVGEVVRSVAARDVALVKTEAVALAPFEVASGEGQAGDDVFVLGSPLGETLAYTVTRGVLSASREVQRLRWLQSDVRVLPGSSGGPMVSRTGALLGITSRGLGDGGAGVNFFVPITDALTALKIEFQAN
jgi:serine protease Do